jgi:stearoyl-CoA desaturase (delta-9 desaturase)
MKLAEKALKGFEPSYSGASGMILKVISLSTVGQIMSTRGAVLVGIVFTAMAMGIAETIASECAIGRFFPASPLNKIGKVAFRWPAWSFFWADPTCPGLLLAVLLRFFGEDFNYPLQAWALKWLLPFVIMNVFKKHASSGYSVRNVQVGYLSPQFGSALEMIDRLELPNLSVSDIPIYRVNKLLTEYFQQHKTEDIAPGSPRYAATPLGLFREFLLWESRDVLFYICLGAFAMLTLAGHAVVASMFLMTLLLIVFIPSKAMRALQGWDLNAFNCIFLGTNHLLAIYGVVCVMMGHEFITGSDVQRATIAWTFFLYPVSAIGITAGPHRLWAHKSYQAQTPLRVLLMLMYTIAFQGSIFHWARDHRTHHRHVDGEKDPHDASQGLFYSHVGCYLLKKDPKVIAAGKEIDVSDLERDWVVMWQKRVYGWFGPLMCYVMPAVVAYYGWGERFWTGFLLAGVTRYTLVLNGTWCINSLTHKYGERPYDGKELASENWITAILTMGEGWHNWHHTFAHDYATSEMGALQQFNPTKVFIDFFALFGLAYGRKRATNMWEQRKMLWKREGKVVKETVTGPPLFRVRHVTVVDPVTGLDNKTLTQRAAPVEDKVVDSATAAVAETHVKND